MCMGHDRLQSSLTPSMTRRSPRRQGKLGLRNQRSIGGRGRIHPGKGIYTYWNFSYRGGYDRSSGLRMDHLLVSPPLSLNFVTLAWMSNVRGWEKPSDHAPAWIELD